MYKYIKCLELKTPNTSKYVEMNMSNVRDKISMDITNSPCLLTFVQCLLKVKMALRTSPWSSSCHRIFVLMWSQYGCLITSLHVQWLQHTVVTRSPFGIFLVRFPQAKAMAGKVESHSFGRECANGLSWRKSLMVPCPAPAYPSPLALVPCIIGHVSPARQ